MLVFRDFIEEVKHVSDLSTKLFNTLRPAQDLLHLSTLRQLIHQLIQIPHLLCQSILDFLHAIPADYSGDEVRIGV